MADTEIVEGRGTSALFKGSSTQSELSDSILEMKTKALTLREEANVCMQQRIAEMDRKNDLRASRGMLLMPSFFPTLTWQNNIGMSLQKRS
jgi:hypothetical protein